PASDACRMITASAHASVMPKPGSCTPAHIYLEAYALDVWHMNASNWGSQGPGALWASRAGGAGGAAAHGRRPRMAPARCIEEVRRRHASIGVNATMQKCRARPAPDSAGRF